MTLQWFDYLAQRLHSVAFLLLLAYRPEEAPQALNALVARWQYQSVARHLSLSGLNEDEVVSWTRQALSILTVENDAESLALAHALLSSTSE